MGCSRAVPGDSRSRPTVAAMPSGAAIAAIAAIIAGCAGNGNGLDANGRPIVGGSGGNAPLTADFDSIQDHIFTPICSVCHVGGSAPQGLRLDAANSYGLLVGVPSTEVPTILRVKPGDPDNSYIIQKLEGHAAVGAQMPLGGPYLSTTTIAFIREWITNGAPASTMAAASMAAKAMAITSIAPAPGDFVSGPVPQIMVAFNHELDCTRIFTHSVRIERVPIGPESLPSDEIPARLTVPTGSPQVLMVWPMHPLKSGRYRVVYESSSIADIAGVALTGAGADAAAAGAPAAGAPTGGVPATGAPATGVPAADLAPGDSLLTTFDVEASPYVEASP